MEKPKAILFDLCDTLFLFDSLKFPRVVVEGRELRSTLGLIHEVLCRAAPVSFEAFYSVFVQTSREISRVRDEDAREITSEEKFRRVLDRLGLGPDRAPETLLQEAVQAHMNALALALTLPPSHLQMVYALKDRYRLGIISNFDHSPTVHRILHREGIAGYFDPVVISADVGWRKPHREIFEKALGLLGLKAQEALFIGDHPAIDIGGAQGVGIPAIWYNRYGEDPSGLPFRAERTLTDLAELQGFL